MAIRQVFATVDDLNNPSSDDIDVLLEALQLASEYLVSEIGPFIPVTATRKFNGKGWTRLYTPALLSITSITNDGTTLEATDYIKQPDGAHWADGPYSWLEVDPDAANLSEFVDEEEGVVMAALWGMYNRTKATGATVQDTTQQSDSQTTVKVSNGSKVSPGALLYIGTEQEYATGYGDPTAAVTTLGAALTAASETCTFANGALVFKGEILKIEFEQVKLLDVQSNTGYLQRGYNGTTKAAHSNSTSVAAYRTFNVERGVNGTTAAAHLNGVAISQYLAPDRIRFLTQEIATLALMKAKGNYAGRTGNVELGQVFYHDVFPRFDIGEIKKQYVIPGVP